MCHGDRTQHSLDCPQQVPNTHLQYAAGGRAFSCCKREGPPAVYRSLCAMTKQLWLPRSPDPVLCGAGPRRRLAVGGDGGQAEQERLGGDGRHAEQERIGDGGQAERRRRWEDGVAKAASRPPSRPPGVVRGGDGAGGAAATSIHRASIRRAGLLASAGSAVRASIRPLLQDLDPVVRAEQREESPPPCLREPHRRRSRCCTACRATTPPHVLRRRAYPTWTSSGLLFFPFLFIQSYEPSKKWKSSSQIRSISSTKSKSLPPTSPPHTNLHPQSFPIAKHGGFGWGLKFSRPPLLPITAVGEPPAPAVAGSWRGRGEAGERRRPPGVLWHLRACSAEAPRPPCHSRRMANAAMSSTTTSSTARRQQ
jgi:hypothetical protein